MKRICRFFACLVMFVVSAHGKTFGDNAPADWAVLREQTLSRVTFTWKRDHFESQNGLDESSVEKDVRQATEEAKAEAAKEHITDPAKVKDMIDSYASVVTKGDIASQFEAKNDLVFQGDGDKLIVSGKIQHTDSLLGSYSQYIIGDDTVLFVDSLTNNGVAMMGYPSAYVYSTPTSGFRHDTPLSTGFDLAPADYAMLAGKNPLLIDGQHYPLVADNGDVAIYGGDLPVRSVIKFRIRIAYNKKLKAVTEISTFEGVSEQPYQDWNAYDFKNVLGAQVPTRIEYFLNSNWGKYKTLWTLLNITPSAQVEVSIPLKTPVSDYRLFGPNVKRTDVDVDTEHAKVLAKRIDYNWRGRLPSIDELKNLQRLQYPKDAAKFGKSRVIASWGAPIACVIGGIVVIVFNPKRRPAS